MQGRGKVCDLGCGVGHIARHLHTREVEIFGLDISPRMIEIARRLNPRIPFQQGNLLDLELAESSLAGIVAFYSLIHVARHALHQVLTELWQALLPEGCLLIAVHTGSGEVHAEEFLGRQVSIRATLFTSAEIEECLEPVGFTIDDVCARDPYDFKLQTQRLYFSATKVA